MPKGYLGEANTPPAKGYPGIGITRKTVTTHMLSLY